MFASSSISRVSLVRIFGSAVIAAGAVTAVPMASAAAQGTAVVTPVLKILDFGDVVGLPEGCETGLSAIGAGASQINLSAAASPFISNLDNQCGQIEQEGDNYLQQAITQSYQANGLNTLANPIIADMASALVLEGTNYGTSMAPFGPTVTGLGGTVAFFEGT
jgi:hypothetical protein